MGTRTLILLRHGEYHTEAGGKLDLTPKGRRQAAKVARALRREPIDAVWSSTMVRAIETAAIVCSELGLPAAKASGLLREGFPTRFHGLDLDDSQIVEDRVRAERAFERFFRRSRVDRTELLVCHGNIIRFFVATALHADPKVWTRFIANNCGITRVLVRDSGAIRVASYNECEHLRPHLLT